MSGKIAPQPNTEFHERINATLNQWQEKAITFEEAMKRLEALRQQAQKAARTSDHAGAEMVIGTLIAYSGKNLNAAIDHFEKARALFEKAGEIQLMATCDLNIGETYRLKGNFEQARRLFQSAYETAVNRRMWLTQIIARGNEGQMLLSMERLNEADVALNHAYALSRQHLKNPEIDDRNNIYAAQCEILHALTMLSLEQQDMNRAWEYARNALTAANTLNHPFRLGYANRAIGEVITAIGSAPEDGYESNPDVYFQAALDAFTGIDAQGEVGKTLYTFGNSLAQRGKREAADRNYQEAIIIFTRLGMVDDAAKTADAQLQIL